MRLANRFLQRKTAVLFSYRSILDLFYYDIRTASPILSFFFKSWSVFSSCCPCWNRWLCPAIIFIQYFFPFFFKFVVTTSKRWHGMRKSGKTIRWKKAWFYMISFTVTYWSLMMLQYYKHVREPMHWKFRIRRFRSQSDRNHPAYAYPDKNLEDHWTWTSERVSGFTRRGLCCYLRSRHVQVAGGDPCQPTTQHTSAPFFYKYARTGFSSAFFTFRNFQMNAHLPRE